MPKINKKTHAYSAQRYESKKVEKARRRKRNVPRVWLCVELRVIYERVREFLKICFKLRNFRIITYHSRRFYRHISVVKKLLGQYLYIRINYIY